MNTSYNYADFIGLNLGANNVRKTCVDSKIKQQGKKLLPAKKVSRLNDEFSEDKTEGQELAGSE